MRHVSSSLVALILVAAPSPASVTEYLGPAPFGRTSAYVTGALRFGSRFYKIPDEARFVNRLRDMFALEDGDTLWLAGGPPRRWLESKDGIRVNNLVTYSGPVSYTMRSGSEPRLIETDVQIPTRNPAHTVWMVVPTPSAKSQSVTINGREWTKIDAAHKAIELLQDQGPLQIQVRY
jgi:hypothetical protein